MAIVYKEMKDSWPKILTHLLVKEVSLIIADHMENGTQKEAELQ